MTLREVITNTDPDYIAQMRELEAVESQAPIDLIIERVDVLIEIRRRRKRAQEDAAGARRVLAMADAIIAECDAEARKYGAVRA